MAKTYRIHPAIGVARVGNSPEEFFIGPEKPGEPVSQDSLPAGGPNDFRYKDSQFRIKRQAARFRIFEYGDDGKPGKEITLQDADVVSITWTVELANTKTWFRNGSADEKLKLAPPPVSVSQPGTKTPITHMFPPGGPMFSGKTVVLGEARSESGTGRLIFLGGLGLSDSVKADDDLDSHDDNPNWHDDISDGPVRASIMFKGAAQPVEAVGAWVAVGPPDFAPPMNSVVTLYDLLFQQALERGVLKKPDKVSFVDDIFPIINRAFDVKWLTAADKVSVAHYSFSEAATDAESAKVLCDDAYGWVRSMIHGKLRNPDPVKFPGPNGNMPLIMGDGDTTDTFTLTPFQYEMMVAWANKPENSNPDNLVGWVRNSLAKPLTVPEQLDRAALEACVGGAFHPGIEVTTLIRDKSIYMAQEAFRLDQSKLAPGALTKEMALPWQADFFSCRRHPPSEDIPWWPWHRPDDVFPETDQSLTTQATWTRDIIQWPVLSGQTRRVDRLTMNARWHLLGFVVRRDDKYPETERNPTIKWLTPTITFKDVPEGYGASRPIDIEVKSSLKINFKVAQQPSLPANFTFDKTEITVEPTGPSEFKKIRFWVTYQGGQAGQQLNDKVFIEALQADGPCAENHCRLGMQEIAIQASSIKRQASATMLVLDRSGSMQEIVLNEQRKIDVLRTAAKSFVELVLKDDGIGIVGYNDKAQKISAVTKIGPEGKSDQARKDLMNAIDSDALEPTGETSIGSGLVKASEIIKQADKTSYPLSAFVVLTDGKENHTPHIDSPEVKSAVESSVTKDKIYAIGLGQPDDVNVEKLDALTQGSDEHKSALMLTGDLSASDDQFRLQKYFVQILAGVNNKEIVLDPHGELPYGGERRIPFHMTEADIGMDAILLSTSPRALDFRLENPLGQVLGTGQPMETPSLKYVLGDGLSFYRLFFASPHMTTDRVGLWHAVLRFGETGQGMSFQKTDVAHISYSLIVHAYSNLCLKATARQESYAPGAEILLRASVTEFEIPVSSRVRVWAEVTDPRGELKSVDLNEVEPGQFAARLHTSAEGIYHARIRASGETLQGATFSREQTLTPSVSHGADAHRPHGCRGCLPTLLRRLLRL